jgi:hypothetical protein
MRPDIVPGVIFPDYELSHHTAKQRKWRTCFMLFFYGPGTWYSPEARAPTRLADKRYRSWARK